MRLHLKVSTTFASVNNTLVLFIQFSKTTRSVAYLIKVYFSKPSWRRRETRRISLRDAIIFPTASPSQRPATPILQGNASSILQGNPRIQKPRIELCSTNFVRPALLSTPHMTVRTPSQSCKATFVSPESYLLHQLRDN